MRNSKAKSAVCAALMAAALLGATQSFAETSAWRRHHPRRAEVNGRLANQNRRITNGVRSGELTRGEAHQLRSEDRNIRREERVYASRHGGHVSKHEKKVLNQQENAVSHQIYEEKHD